MPAKSARLSVGLEIDSGVVRAVEAAGSHRAPRLLNMVSAPLPDGSVEEGMIVRPGEVGETLRRLWSAGSIKNRSVLLGVSNQGVLVRHAIVPKVSPDKLGNVIMFHAQDLLPIPLDSVVLDHQVIGETVAEEGDMLEVILVAARRDMLEGFLEALDLAGLEADDIDVSTLALLQTLPSRALGRTVALLNVANGLSNILVAAQGFPRLARLVSVKIKDLAQQLDCPLPEVIPAAQAAGSKDSYEKWLSGLVNETRSSLTYYQNQENTPALEAMIINGRGALLRGIGPRLENALGLPVRMVNPFAAYMAQGVKQRQVAEIVEYAICAGLARRGLGGS